MKKNTMMRLASFLLIAVLISTSAISGTYAKYVTSDSASDTARVAKWGVELQVVGNLFGTSYKDNIVKSAKDTDDKITVQAADWEGTASDVVAPGTQNTGEGFTFSLKGKPEVDGEVTTTLKVQNVFLKAGSYGVMIPVAANVITADNYGEFTDLYVKTSDTSFQKPNAFRAGTTYYTLEDEAEVTGNNYYPVVYSLAGNTSTIAAETTTTSDSLIVVADKIAGALELTSTGTTNSTTTYTGTKSFETNTDLSTWNVDGLTVTWAWAFENVNDGADTILGMLENTSSNVYVVKKTGADVYSSNMIEYSDYCLNTQFDIEITATQVN